MFKKSSARGATTPCCLTPKYASGYNAHTQIQYTVGRYAQNRRTKYIIIILFYIPAMLESHRPCGHRKNTSEKMVYSSDFFQSLNHNTISQQLNIGLNSFLYNI